MDGGSSCPIEVYLKGRAKQDNHVLERCDIAR